MSRLFDRASNEALSISSTPISSEPFSLAAWWWSDDGVNDQSILSVGDSGGTFYYVILFDPGGGSLAAYAYDGDSNASATTTTTPAASTWNHGLGVFASNGDFRVYLNGGGKGTDADAHGAITIDRIRIGVSADSTPYGYFSGRIAEACIWNAALQDAHAVALARGYPPWRILPGNLVGFWLPFGGRTDRDFGGRGYHMSPVNTPEWAVDPPETLKRFRGNAQHVGRRLVGKERWHNNVLPLASVRSISPILTPYSGYSVPIG